MLWFYHNKDLQLSKHTILSAFGTLIWSFGTKSSFKKKKKKMGRRRRFLCHSEAGWASEEAALRCRSTLLLSTPLQNLPPLPAFVSHSSFQSLRHSIPLPTTTGTIMLRLSCKPLALEGWSQEKLTASEGWVSELAFLCSSLKAKSLLSLLPSSISHAGIHLLRPVSLPY